MLFVKKVSFAAKAAFASACHVVKSASELGYSRKKIHKQGGVAGVGVDLTRYFFENSPLDFLAVQVS